MKKSSLATLVAILAVAGATQAQQDPNVPQYVPGEVLVKFKETAQDAELDDAVNRGALSVRKHIRGRAGLALMNTRLHTEAALQALQNHAAIEYVQPNWIYTHQSPNDPYYSGGNLWGVYGDDAGTPYGPAGTTNPYGSQAEKAWAKGFTGSQDVYVAVIDEGLQPDHPDLAANVWTNPGEIAGNGVDDDGNGYIDDVHGWNAADDNGNIYDPAQDDHGTHVAGTIGAAGNNGVGLVGVNWNVKMISAKFLGAGGGYTSDAIEAIDYIVNLKNQGLNVVAINASWGGGGFDQALLNSIVEAAQAEILFIAAAGNGDWLGRAINNDSYPHYPSNYDTKAGAGYDSVISVTAIDSAGNKASWANYGATSVDLGAPGVGILSTLPGSTYGSYNGTSMATPHVAGAAALIAASARNSDGSALSAAQLRSFMLTEAVPTPNLNGRTFTGGRLNLGGLVNPLPEPEPVTLPAAPTGLTASAAPRSEVNLAWVDNSANEDEFRVEISTDGQNFSYLGKVPANSTSARVTGLSRKTKYWFRAAAANEAGQSSYSNAASVVTK